MNLAASLEVSQPSERLVFAQACGSRDHRGRERAGHLAQCRSQAIPTRLGLAPLSLRLRRHDSGGIGRSGLGCGLTSNRRVVTEPSSAAAAQDHRLTSRRADHLKPTPSAPRATDAAATPGALHLDQVRIVHWLSTVIIGRRCSGTDGGSPVTASMAPRPAIPSASANRSRSSSADTTSGGEGESASSDAPGGERPAVAGADRGTWLRALDRGQSGGTSVQDPRSARRVGFGQTEASGN